VIIYETHCDAGNQASYVSFNGLSKEFHSTNSTSDYRSDSVTDRHERKRKNCYVSFKG